MIQGLLDSGVVKICSCKLCQLYMNKGYPPRVFRFRSTDWFIMTLNNRLTYWKGCPRGYDISRSSLEQFFYEVDEIDKEYIIFNIDIFRKEA